MTNETIQTKEWSSKKNIVVRRDGNSDETMILLEKLLWKEINTENFIIQDNYLFISFDDLFKALQNYPSNIFDKNDLENYTDLDIKPFQSLERISSLIDRIESDILEAHKKRDYNNTSLLPSQLNLSALRNLLIKKIPPLAINNFDLFLKTKNEELAQTLQRENASA